jgi:hypothetical protein
MGDALSRRLVPDELWALAESLPPELFSARPQGGGTAVAAGRVVFTATGATESLGPHTTA